MNSIGLLKTLAGRVEKKEKSRIIFMFLAIELGR